MDWYLHCKIQKLTKVKTKKKPPKNSLKNLAFIELNKTEAYEVTWLKLHYVLEFWKNN